MNGECSCWCEYPNDAHKRDNGKWRCVDDYVCVKPLGKSSDGKRGYKTKCVRKELMKEKQSFKQVIAKKDLLVGTSQFAIHIREGQIWDIRIVPNDEYEYYRISRDCISLELSADEFKTHFDELTESENDDV